MNHTKLKLSAVALTLALGLSACSGESPEKQVQSAESEQMKAVDVDKSMPMQSIESTAKRIGESAANWQIAQFGNLDYIPESHRAKSENAKFWIQASFYIGLTRWIDATDDKQLESFVKQVAEKENYELILERPYHADDHAIAQTYLWLAERAGVQEAYMPTKEVFDMILSKPPQVGLNMGDSESSSGKYHLEGNCQLRWCWADALFMAPRAWAQMTKVTSDPKYLEYGNKEFWAAADYLFSDEYGLFFRDSRYFDAKSDNGEPVFWGRGNGWVFAAIPMIIEELPEGHPSKDRYIELYKKHAEGLMALQKEDGYWPASLMDPDKVRTPEVSGTGFITFGLAWGVNNGILTDQRSKDVVEKGWSAITKAVTDDGRVNWVQHVGKSPDPVKESDSQLYGTGAVLLAASEMLIWNK
ncbi:MULTISPECIES: glycoside hydrolase family 88/105 protein [unclassified Alteromonas]|uniref:Unsaturated 3S-rhamnoglycuronyl hydrolase n=1 Tax=Alteromonas sp. (strain LOR) TaxID=1537994 RepID=UH105_ALTSL|nr:MULTISPECIES: glycoside hydrolase family 88 protein [unclassified Alteromonas]P9WF04.1 RecName: Full=Unsaturated 3S-rhamnoglycuronyl hydrolase; AltName: Full=Ulvan hydrolase; AltName: Full=Unsaturated beta-glucuronyl hydrolase; Short=UGL; Flags: Precursor [Alteromonas sp. LOR]